MKKDFETFFNEIDFRDLLVEWDKAIKEIEKVKKIAFIFCIIIDIFILAKFGFSIIDNFELSDIMIMIVGIGAVICVDSIIYYFVRIFYSKNYKKYNLKYKEIIIEQMLKEFFSEVNYTPEKDMSNNIYEDVYGKNYGVYISEDYMDALIDNKYRISMAEVITTEEAKKSNIDLGRKKETSMAFYGIFAKVDLEKSINSRIKIVQNQESNMKEKVEMDSSEFEEYFDVDATNNIVAMQILTHDVMGNLVKLRKILRNPFDVIINNDCMYIRLHIGEMFESKLKLDELIDKDIAENYYNIINFIYILSKGIIKAIEETEI